MAYLLRLSILVILLMGFTFGKSFAQLTAPGSSYTELTQYPQSSTNDPIFIFCGSEGSLKVNTTMAGEKTFTWELYNSQTGEFDTYFSEVSSGSQSTITQLADGGYRVTVVSSSGQEVFRGWLFNHSYTLEAGVKESTCDYFSLEAVVTPPATIYFDPLNGTPVTLDSDYEVEWREGESTVSRNLNPTIYNPPTFDTEYVLTVTDRFGCVTEMPVMYYSIVTKAIFSADPMTGEAPLEVVFTNQSENGDSDGYEWFFFKNLDEIKQISQGSTVPVDSIMEVAYDHSPVYIYENSGIYMVKLVSKKTSEFFTCTDTTYLETHIVVDTSYIAAPNVFTPNGDGVNDNFVVKFWSMQEVKISIFNRWGRLVHLYENSNVQGFRNTWLVSAWDGRIGGRYASPGVYFYVVEGRGRDGQKRWDKGFFHLYRGKD